MAIGLLSVLPPACGVTEPTGGRAAIPQYLIFQLFIYGPSPDGNVPSPALNNTDISTSIDQILAVVNHQVGDGTTRQLGFALGPMTLDHTDDQLRKIIRGGFALAQEKGLAVAFHMDNSMFWMRRSDLWSVHDNVEWTDWDGTAGSSQEIGWLPGVTLAPQMCWNSPALKHEVGRILRDVVAPEVARGIDHLRSIGKAHLYAGFIAGWETFIQPGTGYCGLTNLGYSATNMPEDMDEARATLTHDWLEFFAGELVAGGVPTNRLYTHLPQPTKNPLTVRLGAPPWTGYNENSLAGFSTYDLDKHGPELFADLAARGNARWASSEGTNYNMSPPSPSTLTWDRYLGDMLAHNVALINVFGWNDPTPFGKATMSDEAKAVYRKFVSGQPLQ